MASGVLFLALHQRVYLLRIQALHPSGQSVSKVCHERCKYECINVSTSVTPSKSISSPDHLPFIDRVDAANSCTRGTVAPDWHQSCVLLDSFESELFGWWCLIGYENCGVFFWCLSCRVAIFWRKWERGWWPDSTLLVYHIYLLVLHFELR